MLNTILHGAPGAGVPLVIAHGLYGSARNWGVIAKRLSETRQVIAVDMRNHGSSPRETVQGYPEMAADLAEVIAAHGGRADLLGHSMGGKAAMVLALSQPDLIERLMVADIAPVAYTHSQIQYVEAMKAVDLSEVSRRSDADAQLAASVPSPRCGPSSSRASRSTTMARAGSSISMCWGARWRRSSASRTSRGNSTGRRCSSPARNPIM